MLIVVDSLKDFCAGRLDLCGRRVYKARHPILTVRLATADSDGSPDLHCLVGRVERQIDERASDAPVGQRGIDHVVAPGNVAAFLQIGDAPVERRAKGSELQAVRAGLSDELVGLLEEGRAE